MPRYKFRAKDKSGNTVQDIVEAADPREAAKALRERGLYPIEIRPAGSRASTERSVARSADSSMDAFFSGVNIKALAICFTQIATMLRAGMGLHEALQSLSKSTRGRLGKILTEAAESVGEGNAFSQTLQKYPAIFNTLIISMVKAGESSGQMDEMASMIAQNLEFELGIRRSVSKVMFYPYIILLFIIVTPHVPALILEGGSAFITSLAASLKSWLPGLLIALVAIKLLMRLASVRKVWDSIKIKPPVIGAAAGKLAYSRFARALSSLYSSGLPMHEALRISADASGNLAVAQKLKAAVEPVASGQNFTSALMMTGALPPMVLDMLSVGEKTGNYRDVLESAATHMETEADASFNKASMVLFVLCILGAGLVVGSMVLRFYVGAATGIMNGGEL